MPTRLERDGSISDGEIPGVDRHYYEKQVPASSPFSDNSFALATAIAKDRARHELIKAVQKADEDARASSFTGFGNDSLKGQLSVSRSIDGNDQATLDNIKL